MGRIIDGRVVNPNARACDNMPGGALTCTITPGMPAISRANLFNKG